jgi:hypothetical protein
MKSMGRLLNKHLLRPSSFWLASLLAVTATQAVRADVMSFAQFQQVVPSERLFVYTNNGGQSATFNSEAAGVRVMLTFDESQAMHGLSGIQMAHLFLEGSTTSPASRVPDPDNPGRFLLNEVFPTATNMIRIVLDNPVMGFTNFLTVRYSDVFSGNEGATSGGLRASAPGDTVVFTSDFFNFNGSQNNDFSLSFSSIINDLDPLLGLQQGTGNFLQSFTASGSGTFAADFGGEVPEPSTILLAGCGVLGLLGAAYRRRASGR